LTQFNAWGKTIKNAKTTPHSKIILQSIHSFDESGSDHGFMLLLDFFLLGNLTLLATDMHIRALRIVYSTDVSREGAFCSVFTFSMAF
jgi:hypothetical protein